MKILPIRHKHQISYLIQTEKFCVLFDAGWPGSFPIIAQELKRQKISFSEIKYLIVSHFHKEHAGAVQPLKDQGLILLIHSVQKNSPEEMNRFFVRKPDKKYSPIKPEGILTVSSNESRILLDKIGIVGEIIPTPGHSADSISLVLDNDAAFIGDLPHLELVEAYNDPIITNSWHRVIEFDVERVYPAHGVAYKITGD